MRLHLHITRLSSIFRQYFVLYILSKRVLRCAWGGGHSAGVDHRCETYTYTIMYDVHTCTRHTRRTCLPTRSPTPQVSYVMIIYTGDNFYTNGGVIISVSIFYILQSIIGTCSSTALWYLYRHLPQ